MTINKETKKGSTMVLNIKGKAFKRLVARHIADEKRINATIEPLFNAVMTEEQYNALHDILRASLPGSPRENYTVTDNIGFAGIYTAFAFDRIRQAAPKTRL
jgi:hypothetical protein